MQRITWSSRANLDTRFLSYCPDRANAEKAQPVEVDSDFEECAS